MKQDTELVWVCVEATQTFLMRYMVQVPKSNPEWAEDSVVMGDIPNTPLNEFSQKDVGLTVMSHRVISEEDALALCDKDNSYGASWTKEKKLEVFFTPWNHQDT